MEKKNQKGQATDEQVIFSKKALLIKHILATDTARKDI